MATQVWKCDHCRCETNESFDVIVEHEKKCTSNPENKFCWSCAHHESDGFWIYGGSFSCKKGLSVDHFEDEGNCEKWE